MEAAAATHTISKAYLQALGKKRNLSDTQQLVEVITECILELAAIGYKEICLYFDKMNNSDKIYGTWGRREDNMSVDEKFPREVLQKALEQRFPGCSITLEDLRPPYHTLTKEPVPSIRVSWA